MITVVIPARMASSRYPGKPLAEILGLPMVEHVRRRSLLAKGVDLVAVATCDESIKAAVEAFGGRAILTKDTHERCTDRDEEAMQTLPGDIVALVQGDEPLLNRHVLKSPIASAQAISISTSALKFAPGGKLVRAISMAADRVPPFTRSGAVTP